MDNAGQGQGDRTVRGKSEAPLLSFAWVSGWAPNWFDEQARDVPKRKKFAGRFLRPAAGGGRSPRRPAPQNARRSCNKRGILQRFAPAAHAARPAR
jgi:hypothetical protein